MAIGTLIGTMLVRCFWLSVAATHFLGRTWDSVEKLWDSAKSNTAVCVDYFKSQKLDSESKSDGNKVDEKSSPVGSENKAYVSGRGSDKKVGRLEVSRSMCTAINDVVDVSGKVLLDVYLTGLGVVKNNDGTMWYWPWCVFHDKCHIKPKQKGIKEEDFVAAIKSDSGQKALAEAIQLLQVAEVIKDGTFVQEKFNAKWPPKVEIIQHN